MSASPDNDDPAPISAEGWSHVKETVNMLYLAICQIDSTMNDSNASVSTLTHSFTTLATHTQSVSDQVQSLTEPEELENFKQDLSDTAKEIQANISASVQAFQFYDRVCQRLDHVSKSLEHVSELLASENRFSEPVEWQKVQLDIKSSYTMEAERIMFEHLMRGGSVKEALKIYSHHFEQEESKLDQDNDEIELF